MQAGMRLGLLVPVASWLAACRCAHPHHDKLAEGEDHDVCLQGDCFYSSVCRLLADLTRCKVDLDNSKSVALLLHISICNMMRPKMLM